MKEYNFYSKEIDGRFRVRKTIGDDISKCIEINNPGDCEEGKERCPIGRSVKKINLELYVLIL